MSQKSIKSFFASSLNRTIKRSSSNGENIDTSNVLSEVKKVKVDDSSSDRDVVKMQELETISLKPDTKITDEMKGDENSDLDFKTKQRIENNKLAAELKILSKQLPALHHNIGITWFKALRDEFDKPYFKKLSKFLKEERSETTPIHPRPDEVWTWTRECGIGDVKAVILGQDPYHHPGQAHGLSFSVPLGVPPPPSLLNMFKELEDDIEGFKRPGHGNLIGWSRQGVLLLNAVLTVRSRNANSHKDQGWERLTDAVIKHLNASSEGIIFLLWGSYAQKKAEFVDEKRHHVLKAVHPSPLSASRGFFGCKHFSKCNELLVKQGKEPINWCRLPAE